MSRHIQHYEQFGPTVYGIIRSHMAPDGRISDLLIKLHLPVTADVEQQHQILAKFLFQFGVTFFLEAIAQRDPEEIERMKTRRLLEGIGIKRKEPTVPKPVPPPGVYPVPPTPLPSQPQSGGVRHISVPGYEGPDRRKGRDRHKGDRGPHPHHPADGGRRHARDAGRRPGGRARHSPRQ